MISLKKKPLHILITSASRKVALIQSFQQALKRHGGGKVIAVDSSPLSAALYLTDQSALVPLSTQNKALPEMLSICKKWNVQAIIPTRDEDLLFFSRHRTHFEKIGVQPIVASEETICLCQDKRRFIEFCRQEGFDTPKTFEMSEIKKQSPFPLYVKPVHGKGGKGAFRMDTWRAFSSRPEMTSDSIAQEMIQLPEYTVDLFADLQGKIISVVPRRRIGVFGGESFVSETVKAPELIKEAQRLAQSLHLIGHNTLQCFMKKSGKPLWIEVNPRFGGAAALGFAAGASSPDYLVRLLNQETLKPQIGAYKTGLTMLRYTSDYFIDSKKLLHS
jgi:carbamoyl-phosphate synthase large subunit